MANPRRSGRPVHSNKYLPRILAVAAVESLEPRLCLSALSVEELPTRLVAESTQLLQSALTVAVNDQTYSGKITLSLTGSNPGTLSGTTSLTAQGGSVYFANITFSAPGNYNLLVTDDRGDTPITCPINNVLPPTAADHIAIINQPTLDPATGGFDATFQVLNPLGQGVSPDPTDPGSEVVLHTFAYTPATFPDGMGTINAMPDSHGLVTFTDIGLSLAGITPLDSTPTPPTYPLP